MAVRHNKQYDPPYDRPQTGPDYDPLLRDPDTGGVTGFDVTCVVGRVEFGNGDVAPHVAAFQIIASHDAEGTYTFPMADGRTCVVSVDFKGDGPVTYDEHGLPR